MSDSIEVKQLRNEVQLLRDELAIMKRKFEDILYNLDTDNFSSRFVKEQGDMRAAFKFAADGIKTMVSNDKFQSAMTQTAALIETKVNNLDKTLSSEISQTASAIRQEVANIETGLSSEISQTANDISLRVNSVEGKTNSISVSNKGIEIDGNQTHIKGVIYLTYPDGENAVSLFCNRNIGGNRLYLNSAYNADGDQLDYVIIGDDTQAYDYDTDTYEESHNVYVGQESGDWKVATEGWVKKKIAAGGGSGGSTVAKFG